jgi:hypothetical protein
MEPLNPHFFILRANNPEGVPFVRDWHPLDENWAELPQPRVELANVRKRLPACIGPFQSGGPLLFREDIVRKIEEENLSGLVAKPVEVVKLNGKKVFDRSLPVYFSVKALGKMITTVKIYRRAESEYIYEYSAPSLNDPNVQATLRDYGRFVPRIIPQESEWDGTDFFNIQYQRGEGEINCTRRFVELAHEEKWDNLYFQQIDNLRPRTADFETFPWPPELWYPNYQPTPTNLNH